jgi:multidrug transporter EmrE-like cation transporter
MVALMPAYVTLALAIIFEVIGTSAMKASEGFTRPGPTLIVALGYGLAFLLLSQVLDRVPVGIAYAIWSGGGIVLIAIAAWVVYGQRPDLAGLIIAGVLILNLLSKTNVH